MSIAAFDVSSHRPARARFATAVCRRNWKSNGLNVNLSYKRPTATALMTSEGQSKGGDDMMSKFVPGFFAAWALGYGYVHI